MKAASLMRSNTFLAIHLQSTKLPRPTEEGNREQRSPPRSSQRYITGIIPSEGFTGTRGRYPHTMSHAEETLGV
ncbi:hypothetical protein J6590_023621 [Homalodisca vitripennis]|nr:hypothetical protein J6590_023621 [Homalodisca vitripennis]